MKYLVLLLAASSEHITQDSVLHMCNKRDIKGLFSQFDALPVQIVYSLHVKGEF